MTADRSYTLYATPAADRFFLVPAGGDMAEGTLTVVAVTGGERHVDPDAVALFEVTRDQAQAHVRAEAEQALAGVADTLARALGVAGGQPPDLQRLAERLGVSGGDRKAAEAAFKRLADDVQAVTAAVASGDVDAARARLKARGIDLGDLPDHLERLQRVDREAAAVSLRGLADELERGEQPLGRRIDELIVRLEHEVGPWLGRDPERVKQQRQEEYRTSARSAIADSLREAGITPLNDPREERP